MPPTSTPARTFSRRTSRACGSGSLRPAAMCRSIRSARRLSIAEDRVMANASITNRLIIRLLLVFALAPLIAVVVLLIEGSGRLDLRLHAGRERQADRIREIL